MTTRMRRTAAVAAAVSVSAALAVPAFAAQHTQELSVGAELIKQPKNKPWEVNLLLGATLDLDDGGTPEPVQNMKFSFTQGAKVNSDAFKVCTEATLRDRGPGACPAGSLLGTGKAVAEALNLVINANVRIYNGPGTVKKRQLIVWAKAIEIPTIVLTLPGTLTKTSGKYGWVLDLPIPPIHTIGDGNDASVTGFSVKVGGYGKKKGRKGKVPFIEAPTKCNKPGWPFAADFRYADGATGRATALMDCTIRALPGRG
jgi:hypothetical protein